MTSLQRLIRSRSRAPVLGALIAAGVTLAGSLGPGLAGVSAHAASAKARHRGHHARRHLPLKLIWGPVTLPGGASAFPTYHKLGVQVFQVQLSWAQTAPTEPAAPENPNDSAYHWPAYLDAAVAQAKQYKMRLMMLVQGSPAWANGNKASQWVPLHPVDYGHFLAAAAHRYPSIHLWMVWGEPNRDVSPDFLPMPPNSPIGPLNYALVLNAGYHALKRVSRSNMVIGGNTWSFGLVEPADFVRWMKLPNGKPPPLDYYGHNPFGRRYPRLSEKPYYPGGRDINDIDTLEQQLRAIYHRTVPLWLSEFTISSDHNSSVFNFHVSRAAQARWLRAGFKLADSVSYVAGMGWFTLLDGAPGPGSMTNGLMTWDLKPKPAFAAYEHAR